MAGNKRVVNATAVSEDNIKFRSKAERTMYNLLKDSGLEFRHEPAAIELLKGFYPTHPWYEWTEERSNKVRSITYTPDFVVDGKCNTYIIEVKGFITDRYPLKRKMLLHLMQSHTSLIFFEVHTKRDMLFCIDRIKEIENEHTNTENK